MLPGVDVLLPTSVLAAPLRALAGPVRRSALDRPMSHDIRVNMR